MKWRQGDRDAANIHCQLGDTPSMRDVLIGRMATTQEAANAVYAGNAYRSLMAAGAPNAVAHQRLPGQFGRGRKHHQLP